jgi:hypothetical protein
MRNDRDVMSRPVDPEAAFAELRAGIEDFAAGGHRVDRVIAAACPCGNDTFLVVFDDEVGVAARVCAVCEHERAVADSDEHFDEVESVEQAHCSCGGDVFTAATGFAIGADDEVRWVSVGLRCVQDGVAGVYVDWKIDYAPTAHLLINA